ncbi:4'-phosphopantetheinyl transferase superfamily protein [Marinobacteraceae bacterium S3BR75-40.1]
MTALFFATPEDSVRPGDWLGPEERAYFATLQSPQRQSAFLTSRIALRHGLCRVFGGDFWDWPLDRRGRPGRSGIGTSLSHRPAGVLCGVAAAAVGVDLDGVRQGARWQAIARRWFHPAEVRRLELAAPGDAERLFYQLWCLKEAWVKATGRGLANHFQALVVDESGRLVTDRPTEGWHCYAGWWQDHCLAVATLEADSAGPVLYRLHWDSGRPEHLLACEPLVVDWSMQSG